VRRRHDKCRAEDVLAAEISPAGEAECLRIARRLRFAERRVVGFVPATRRDAVPPVALRIGRALVRLSGATVAYVDANVHWPALAALSGEARQDSVYATRWLDDSLALLSPPHVEGAGAVMPQLARVLVDGQELFHHMLVDLTGFDLLGEQAAASTAMDGVIVVARSGRVRETTLLAHREPLPPDKFLGVLLTG